MTFGPAGAANVIRGALGWNLRHVAGETAYTHLFEPPKPDYGPSGFATRPRPFVLRASHLDGTTVAAGDAFQFDIHLFETGEQAAQSIDWLAAALARIAGATLEAVEASTVQVDLTAAPAALSRLRVDFLTPTELKASGDLVERPDFPSLFARARDRVATLHCFYAGHPLDVDFAGLGDRARDISMETCQIQNINRTRRSSRTGQTHGIGGFTGQAIYSGSLAEFWPWLEAAQWTGVGRQTVWGKGQIKIWTMS